MAIIKDITGNRYGRLVVVGFAGRRRSGRHNNTETLWECECDCGAKKIVPKHLLTNGLTKSCGCLKKELLKKKYTKHGGSSSRLYRIHQLMKYRCYIPTSNAYKYYGAKGIGIYDEWLGGNGFSNFKKWAFGNGYEDSLTIERINNNGNYEPNNCIWISQSKQMRNRSNTHWILFDGEKYTLTEASKKFGVDRATIRKYEKKFGGDGEKALKWLLERRLKDEGI